MSKEDGGGGGEGSTGVIPNEVLVTNGDSRGSTPKLGVIGDIETGPNAERIRAACLPMGIETKIYKLQIIILKVVENLYIKYCFVPINFKLF